MSKVNTQPVLLPRTYGFWTTTAVIFHVLEMNSLPCAFFMNSICSWPPASRMLLSFWMALENATAICRYFPLPPRLLIFGQAGEQMRVSGSGNGSYRWVASCYDEPRWHSPLSNQPLPERKGFLPCPEGDEAIRAFIYSRKTNILYSQFL